MRALRALSLAYVEDEGLALAPRAAGEEIREPRAIADAIAFKPGEQGLALVLREELERVRDRAAFDIYDLERHSAAARDKQQKLAAVMAQKEPRALPAAGDGMYVFNRVYVRAQLIAALGPPALAGGVALDGAGDAEHAALAAGQARRVEVLAYAVEEAEQEVHVPVRGHDAVRYRLAVGGAEGEAFRAFCRPPGEEAALAALGGEHRAEVEARERLALEVVYAAAFKAHGKAVGVVREPAGEAAGRLGARVLENLAQPAEAARIAEGVE